MKKLILLLLLVPATVTSQWRVSERNDPFDGKVITAIGYGSGGEFPYRNPRLVFRIQGIKREIYVTDAGSTACDKPYLDISFGDPNSVESFDLSESTDRSAGFINMNETRKIFDLVKNLKKENTVYIKFGTNCSSNRFRISLKGSSKSLSKIFPDIDFSSFKSSYNFATLYSAAENDKLLKSRQFFEKFISEKSFEFSAFDMDQVYKEIEKGVALRKLILTEITLEKHKSLPSTFKLKLGFEGTHYRDTDYVFNKNDNK